MRVLRRQQPWLEGSSGALTQNDIGGGTHRQREASGSGRGAPADITLTTKRSAARQTAGVISFEPTITR
jgi:hypothetical protein